MSIVEMLQLHPELCRKLSRIWTQDILIEGFPVGELLTSLRRMLQSSNTHLIVILDEVDHLLRRSGDDIIYKLMRIDEDREGKVLFLQL